MNPPKMPMPKLGCLPGSAAVADAAVRKRPEMGGKVTPIAGAIGGGADAGCAGTAAWADKFTRNLAVGDGAGGGAGGGTNGGGAIGADAAAGAGSTSLNTVICCSSALALAVPSRWQIGHATVKGIW